jgi:uncharacterized membrane protein
MDTIDFIAKSVEIFQRHELSVTAILLFFLHSLRLHYVNSRIMRMLPRRMQKKSQLDRIEKELSELKEVLERCVPYSDGKHAQSSTDGAGKNSLSSPGATSPVAIIGVFTRIKKAISHLQRRLIKMNTNINYVTLIPALLGVAKLVLQPLGFDLSHITDGQVNDLLNGIAAVLAIIGVFLPHRKVSNGFDETKTN